MYICLEMFMFYNSGDNFNYKKNNTAYVGTQLLLVSPRWMNMATNQLWRSSGSTWMKEVSIQLTTYSGDTLEMSHMSALLTLNLMSVCHSSALDFYDTLLSSTAVFPGSYMLLLLNLNIMQTVLLLYVYKHSYFYQKAAC